MSRRPHLVPPALATGAKRNRWLTAEVEAWLIVRTRKALPAQPKKIGRPRKSEQLKKAQRAAKAKAKQVTK